MIFRSLTLLLVGVVVSFTEMENARAKTNGMNCVVLDNTEFEAPVR